MCVCKYKHWLYKKIIKSIELKDVEVLDNGIKMQK